MHRRDTAVDRRSSGWRSLWQASGSWRLIVLILTLLVACETSDAIQRKAALVVPPSPLPTATATATPKPFDPNEGALLPENRVVAFYGEYGAEVTGPAYQLSDAMLAQLQAQGAPYGPLDLVHPVQLGIDYVADVADPCSGYHGDICSHEMDAAITQQYIDFCQQHGLVLFLDLEFGRANPRQVVSDYLPYLARYPFIHLAIDPEWAMGPYGYPGVDVGSMSAADINWIIAQLAAIPMQAHVPRKVLLIHEFRPEVLPDKAKIQLDPRVSIVLHVDSVGDFAGAIAVKQVQYNEWVLDQLIQYGGFKIFYQREGPYNSVMTPAQVLQLYPNPLVVTYGN